MLNIGIIGAGARVCDVYRSVADAAGNRVRLAGWYDPNADVAGRVRELPGGAQAVAADSWNRIVENPGIDAVMIGSPNAFHADPAIAVMKSGKPLYLEKPLATTIEDHRRVMDAHASTGSRVVLGFVLRYTPFYRAIKDLVASGKLGRLMFVQAVEHMGVFLTADVYLRGWRAYQEHAGPLLLEKCCHDIDIINWLVETPCESVAAFSDQTVFVKNPSRPARCGECDDRDCAYRGEGTISDRALKAVGHHIPISGEDDACVYNRGQDIADHTTLLARYGGGVHVSFNVTMGLPRGGRHIRIAGSKGELAGCAEENKIIFHPLGDGRKAESICPAMSNPGTHYGGDVALAEEFLQMCRNPKSRGGAGIAEGYESGLVCLAAEASARQGQIVDMEDFRKQALRTGAGGANR